jgi:pilus assembly protein CpaE
MSQSPRRNILIVSSDPTLSKLLGLVLTTEGHQVIAATTGEDALDKVPQRTCDMVIIDVPLAGMDSYELCRRLRQNSTTRYLPILMLSSKGDVADKLAGFEAGADEYLTKPFDSKELAYRIRNLLLRAQIPARPHAEPLARGQTIAFFGTKGGVGKTTICVNTAITIQQQTRKRVAIFDGDFFFGDIGVHLNLPPVRSMVDLVERIDEIDADLVNQVMVPHSSGVRVLLSPFRPEKADLVTSEHVKRLLDILVVFYDYVIADCHSAYDERTLSILEKADDIMLVLTPEIGPVKNTALFLDIAPSLGVTLDHIHVILNRANSSVGIEPEEIERSLHHPIEFRIVSGGRPVVMSVNRGVPLTIEKPDHPLAREIAHIAAHLIKKEAPRKAAP